MFFVPFFWLGVSLLYAAVPWMFRSRRRTGIALASASLALSLAAILFGIVDGISDHALPSWIIIPGIFSALTRLARELFRRHFGPVQER